jgi:hypothetical protein
LEDGQHYSVRRHVDGRSEAVSPQTDDQPDTTTIRVSKDFARMAAAVARHHGLAIPDLIDARFRPTLLKEYVEVLDEARAAARKELAAGK